MKIKQSWEVSHLTTLILFPRRSNMEVALTVVLVVVELSDLLKSLTTWREGWSR